MAGRVCQDGKGVDMSMQKIRIRIIVMIMVGAIAIVGVGLVAGLLTTQKKVEATVEGDLSIVGDMADSLITSEINLLREKDISLAGSIAATGNREEILEILNDKMDDAEYKDFIGLTVFDQNGIVCSLGDYPTPVEYIGDVAIQRAFAGDAVFSTVRVEAGSDKPVLHICAPVREGVVLVATVDGLFFHNFLREFRIWETGHVFVIDHEGYMISNLRENWIAERFNPITAAETDSEYAGVAGIMKKMIAGESGVGSYKIGGVERICVYRPITGSLVGWSLGVVAPQPESPMSDVENGFLLVAVICLALCVAAAVATSGPIAKQFRQIEELKEEAENASKAKSDFLANMSHEMRTPLNAIIGLSELTLSGDNTEEEKHENITKVYTAGVTLLGLINDILDISKVEAGKFEIIPVSYDTPSIINDTVSLNIVRIGSRPIEFKIHVDENLPARLIGDDIRVKQIFNNFLSNAFKYTHEGTVEWTVTAERDEAGVLLISRVKDTGIGITPENLERLFQEFNRVDTKANRGTEGTGLGLALTKSLVEMMGGTITVESEYGVGSTFTATLRQQLDGDAVVGKETAEKLQDYNYTEQKRDRSEKLVRRQLPYARVLVVDDVQTNLDVARGMMKPYGMTVDLITSGKEAVRLIREGAVKYDAIFMDHMMPEMDGIEATHIIREEIGSDYAKNVTIIALTANAILGNEEMFLNNGFQAFLTKPIDIIKLDAAINTWVRNKELEQQLCEDPVSCEASATEHADEDDGLFERLAGIPDFDAKIVFSKFGDDAESVRAVLQSYVKSTPSLLDRLRTVDEETLPDYAITVHGVKGSSRSIGAEGIGRLAEALEFAAKRSDLSFVRENSKDFIEQTERLIEDIGAALEEAGGNREHRPAPDPELLTALGAAAAVYDIDAAEEVMSRLESFDYEEGGDLVEWLREQLDLAGFRNIAERLKV
ncbi:hypothetical protein AGMMS49983_19210 [Clostridia bacterium]|nr:hypothetical protein AGMMS49983_19210 [Clostridia bacterium]